MQGAAPAPRHGAGGGWGCAKTVIAHAKIAGALRMDFDCICDYLTAELAIFA